MGSVPFEKARLSLPAYCLQLMQNVPVDEQQRLRTAIDALELVDMPPTSHSPEPCDRMHEQATPRCSAKTRYDLPNPVRYRLRDRFWNLADEVN